MNYEELYETLKQEHEELKEEFSKVQSRNEELEEFVDDVRTNLRWL